MVSRIKSSLLLFCYVTSALSASFTTPVGAQPASPQSGIGASDIDMSADPYPHISRLEKAILGTTFPKEKLSARLARMETKAFGAPVSGNDLAGRSDALDTYVEQKLHVRLPDVSGPDDTADGGDTVPGGDSVSGGDSASGATGMNFGNTAYDTANSNSSNANGTNSDTIALRHGNASTDVLAQANGDLNDYPRVTALEEAIFGQAFVGKPLPDRLAAMELKAFGRVTESGALADRTDALQSYAEKTLHKDFRDVNNIADSGTGGETVGSGVEKLAGALGKTLLGLAGVGSLGPTVIPGFGGIRARPKDELPDDQLESVAAEDPDITAATPPPPTAKLLTQVGWCEEHVFGQTYPNLHLPARLGQLNRQLNFKPGAKDIELMDQMPGLIKLTQSKISIH